MIKSVHNYPISQLFDIDSSVVYAIPKYQREYTWGKVQWESLFDDITDNDPGYFLGSIICINQSDDALSTQSLELVDGQQRLTTLSLLFASIYDALSEHRGQLDDDQQVELINLKRKLVLKKNSNQLRVIPQVHNHNQSDYKAILSDIGIIDEHETAPYAGNRQIYRTIRYFENRIERIQEQSSDLVSELMTLLTKVNQACLVKIEVASHADAYTLFESLNNRGIPLSAIDLIKNRLLAVVDKQYPGQVDSYFQKWTRLLTLLGENYAVQERFFRQFYNGLKEDHQDVVQVPVATRTNLISIYEKLIDNNPVKLLKNLLSAGKCYELFLLQNLESLNEELKSPLINLDRIQGAPSYVLLLSLFINRESNGLNDALLAVIIDFLARFFVRRNLTDTPPTRDLTRLFMSIIDDLRGKQGEEILQTVQRRIIDSSSSDSRFKEVLEGPIYLENRDATRYILCRIAEQSMTRETWQDLWRYEKKKYVWTIEHIFPQGENIPENWVDMMAGGDRLLAVTIQEQCVHNLGNLTLSGFNSTLGVKNFVQKRDRMRNDKPVGYNNGLGLNADLIDKDSWSQELIDERTTRLVEVCLELFPLNNGEKNEGQRL